MGKYGAKTPAILIAHTRSGGTFLASCLSNHPEIFCPRVEPLLGGAEWYAAFPGATKRQILTCITRAMFYKVGMCRVTYEQVDGDVLAYLKEVNARVVHLVRRNVLRVAVSQYITGTIAAGLLPEHVAHSDHPVAAVAIKLNPEAVLERCRKQVEQQNEMTASLDSLGLAVLPVAYGDMTDGEGQETRSLPQWLSHYLCDFLGVEPLVLSAHLRRVNAYPLSTLVSNWDKVKAVLQGTEFQWCLDEEEKTEYRGSAP